MTHPFESVLLANFPQRLEQCASEEWEVMLKELIWLLLVELNRDKQPTDEANQWAEHLLQVLKQGPNPRKVGRPPMVNQAEQDKILYELLGVKTKADAVRAHKQTYALLKLAGNTLPTPLHLIHNYDPPYHRRKPSDAPKDDALTLQKDAALWKRADRAEQAGYQFEKGEPFGRQRKKP